MYGILAVLLIYFFVKAKGLCDGVKKSLNMYWASSPYQTLCLFFHLTFLSSRPIPQTSQLRKPGWNERVNVRSHWTNGLLETLPKLRGMSLRQGPRDQEKVWGDKYLIVLPPAVPADHGAAA